MMHSLYPRIQPYNTLELAVDELHTLYVEESGNPGGIPVLFVHGGPGGGTSEYHRQFFDPARYRIILFDQRGCGRSKPHASLEKNTTQDLIADMEIIRAQLGIESWLLFGGSWGSTLSLLYAQAHPEQTAGLILRGIFLCRQQDIDWFYQSGANAIFPDHWAQFQHMIPDDERDDMVAAYYKRLTGTDEIARMAAAKAWSQWEARAATLKHTDSLINQFGEPHHALAMARIECHYFVNKSFIDENQIIRDIEKIREIPTTIVHGRYDIVCPVEQAWALHDAWPEAELQIMPTAGHAATEPEITDALVKATNAFANHIG